VQLRNRKSFPVAEGDLRKLRLDCVAAGRQAERYPHQLHGGAGASERTGDKIEACGADGFAREQIAQDTAAMSGLLTPARVERYVVAALQPAFDVPVGLAMTDVIDDWRQRIYSPLPTSISGALGCFMPTI
jgi:hypothetical protein